MQVRDANNRLKYYIFVIIICNYFTRDIILKLLFNVGIPVAVGNHA